MNEDLFCVRKFLLLLWFTRKGCDRKKIKKKDYFFGAHRQDTMTLFHLMIYKLYGWYRDFNIWMGQKVLLNTDFHIDDQLLYRSQLFHRKPRFDTYITKDVALKEILSARIVHKKTGSGFMTRPLDYYAKTYQFTGQVIDIGLVLLLLMFHEGNHNSRLYLWPLATLREYQLILYSFDDDGDIQEKELRVGDKVCFK